MVRIRTLLSSVMALALLSSSAHAAETLSDVKVRGSDKGDYSRIVFDWTKLPPYTAKQTGASLVVTFDGPAHFMAGTDVQSLARVKGYKVLSPHAVEIDFADGQTVRHFKADNRLVVDIKGAAVATPPKDTPAAIKPASGHDTPDKKDTAPVNLAKSIEATPPPQKATTAEQEKSVVAPVAPVAVTEKPDTKTPHVAVTSTNTLALAVFQRNGYLWVVEDKDGVKIPPQIEGAPQGTFEKIAATGLSAFRMKLPDTDKPVASGGGLVWRIDFDIKPDAAPKPMPFKRIFGDSTHPSGPSLLWPIKSIRRTATITDPDTGDTITVALVETAVDFSGPRQTYVDVDVLPSAVGLAVVARADDLTITKTPEGVLITKPEGLLISPDKDIMTATKAPPVEPAKAEGDGNKEISRVFDFTNWQMGTKKDLSDNQRLIMSGMGQQTDAKKVENLIGLARLMLSFNYAPEAMGYLDLAEQMVPDMDSNPEFLALRGAAESLSWKPKEGFADFSTAGLSDVGEIPYWKAYTLARLDDWQQAGKILPDDMSILTTYPEDIRNPLALTLAEVALRDGNVGKAKRILDMLASARPTMDLPYASAYDYLTGEYDRQTGKTDDAKKLWKDLTTGKDDLYRAKARFALTMLQLGTKEITADKAIDNLEGLRYAWRGDDLEVSINANLAKAYLEKGEPIKALTMMQLAHSLNPESEQGKAIDADMHDVFKNLFTAEKIKKLSPVEAMTVYNDFADLIPAGAEGEALTRQLAERLADADLLPRATTLLQKQVNGDLQGLDGAKVAIRLAALQNMDGKPDDALASLDKAETFLKGLPAEDVLPRQQDIGLLRAKAFSMKNKPDDAFAALALLPQDDDTLRLRADIAWRGKKWQDAADSLEQLVQNQNITLTRPLTDEQADLILNWAVALYLADNRYVLANLRERYGDYMAATPKAQKFDVVTRPRQAALLADRDTINSIIDETVIFKDFLKSFKTGDDTPSSSTPSSKVPAPVAAPAADTPSQPTTTPDALRNVPGLKTDEVLGD